MTTGISRLNSGRRRFIKQAVLAVAAPAIIGRASISTTSPAKGDGQGAVEFLDLPRGQGRHEGRQLALEHQRQEVAAHRRHPGKAFLRTDDDLGGEPLADSGFETEQPEQDFGERS